MRLRPVWVWRHYANDASKTKAPVWGQVWLRCQYDNTDSMTMSMRPVWLRCKCENGASMRTRPVWEWRQYEWGARTGMALVWLRRHYENDGTTRMTPLREWRQYENDASMRMAPVWERGPCENAASRNKVQVWEWSQFENEAWMGMSQGWERHQYEIGAIRSVALVECYASMSMMIYFRLVTLHVINNKHRRLEKIVLYTYTHAHMRANPFTHHLILMYFVVILSPPSSKWYMSYIMNVVIWPIPNKTFATPKYFSWRKVSIQL